MLFMQTMKDKVAFMKDRITDMEVKFEKKLEVEMEGVANKQNSNNTMCEELKEQVKAVETKQENRWRYMT